MPKRARRSTSKSTINTVTIQPTASIPSTSRTPTFNPDYSYVVSDLRRIGILAGSFVGLLIILSFIIK